jgi:hypothetical protein
MLAGAPSGDLGIGALKLVPEPSDVRALYARRPPFLPLLLRPHGVFSDAVVNNFYMVGYSGVGIDMGFEALHDHRYAVEDTAEILANATAELEARRASRFFMFVNFNSPHVPYQPPKSAKAAVPRPPVGPRDHLVREYLAEIHKDDAAIGSLIEKLDELGLSRDTLVIVTADHGETLSEEHQIVPDGVDGGPAISGRFHHLSSLYDETAHVPLIMVLPDKLPRARKISDPISTIDIAPTLLDLAGLPVPDAVGGRSLLSLIGGKRDPERTLYVEGRGAHSIRVGRWLLLLRDAAFRHVRSKGRRYSRAVELYDLETDPGQRVDVAKRHPDVVARLTKLDAARGAHSRRPGKDAGDAPIVHLRFAGAGAKHRVTGTLSVAGDASLVVTPIGLPPTTILGKGATSELAFETEATASVGFDVRVEPPDAELTWTFSVDGRPLPKEATHAGGFGLFAPELATGLRDAAARRESAADESPFIDPERDFGLFVSRDRAGREIEIHAGTDAQQEAMGLMRAWGYVRGPAAPP